MINKELLNQTKNYIHRWYHAEPTPAELEGLKGFIRWKALHDNGLSEPVTTDLEELEHLVGDFMEKMLAWPAKHPNYSALTVDELWTLWNRELLSFLLTRLHRRRSSRLCYSCQISERETPTSLDPEDGEAEVSESMDEDPAPFEDIPATIGDEDDWLMKDGTWEYQLLRRLFHDQSLTPNQRLSIFIQATRQKEREKRVVQSVLLAHEGENRDGEIGAAFGITTPSVITDRKYRAPTINIVEQEKRADEAYQKAVDEIAAQRRHAERFR